MKTIIIAPHPDDEILGAGGTLLRRKAEGGSLAWLIASEISIDGGWSKNAINKREEEISKIRDLIGFDEVHFLKFSSTKLDLVPMSEMVSAISQVFEKFKPNEVLMPHRGDVHTDHQVLFEAVSSATKWFRHGYIDRILCYETLSETDFGLAPEKSFRPNVFVNIENFLDHKMQAMNIYESEMGNFPFPRSSEAIRGLAAVRGAASGFRAAEAFELLRERSA